MSAKAVLGDAFPSTTVFKRDIAPKLPPADRKAARQALQTWQSFLIVARAKSLPFTEKQKAEIEQRVIREIGPITNSNILAAARLASAYLEDERMYAELMRKEET
jgi:hypothetical protein